MRTRREVLKSGVRLGAALLAPASVLFGEEESGVEVNHRWATRNQVETCYPRFVEFLKLKKKHDPSERFQSDWYRHYRQMFADRL